MVSCHSTQHAYRHADMTELARAGIRLGFDIEEDDDWGLMLESARWMGTPYAYGGNTLQGIDCSGLTCAIYSNVYKTKLHRRSIDQYKFDCHSVGVPRQGDLLFFAFSDQVNVSHINHVGIHLRDNRFIHASSSRGVVVDNMTSYFQRHLVAVGRVKQ